MVMCVWRGATARRRRSRHLLYESSFRRLHAHATNYFLQWRAIVGACLSLSMLTASCECLTSSLAEWRHRSLARGAGSSGHVAGATRVGAVYTLLPGAAYLSRDNVSHRSSSRRCIDPMACVTVLLYCSLCRPPRRRSRDTTTPRLPGSLPGIALPLGAEAGGFEMCSTTHT